MKRIGLAVAMVLLATSAQAQDRPLRVTLAALQTADLTTTAISLGLGAYESNVLMPRHSVVWNSTAQVGAIALSQYALARLHRSHPKLANTFTIIGIIAESWAVQNNIVVARRQRVINTLAGR